MNNHQKRNKVLAFEQLEGRQLLAAVSGSTATAIVKAAAKAHEAAPQYITPQQRLLNSIRSDVDRDLTTTMKATDKAHRDNDKDIAAAAKANNKIALKSEFQDQKDLERARRSSISEHETNEQFLDRIQRRLNEGRGEYHREIEENKVKALRGQQTFEQFERNQVRIINEQLIDLNGIAKDAREVQAEDQNDQIVSRNQIESIRNRRGGGTQGVSIGVFSGNPIAVTLPGGTEGETTANLTIELFRDGNKLTSKLKSGTWSIYNVTTKQNDPATALSVDLSNATIDANGKVTGTITFGIKFVNNQSGQTSFTLRNAKLTADGFSTDLPAAGNNSQLDGVLKLKRN